IIPQNKEFEKRRSSRKSGKHRKRSDTSSGGSFLDENDREVSSLTDRAFKSLCIGDEAVYNDSHLGLPSSSTHIDRQLAFTQGEPFRDEDERDELKRAAHQNFSLRVQHYGQDWVHGGMYGTATQQDPEWGVYGDRTQGRVSATFQNSFVETSQQGMSLREEELSFISNGATELSLHQHRSRSRVSSLIRTFNSEVKRNGASMDDQFRGCTEETRWDKSALMNMHNEFSDFSSSYQQNLNINSNFPSAGPFSCRDANFYGSDMAAVAHMSHNSVSSFMRSSHNELSMSAQTNCNSHFFIHSEFSPFKVWREHNRFPFQQRETPMYKELSLENQLQGPYRGMRHSNNLAPRAPSNPSHFTSMSLVQQKASAVEKRSESELAGHYPQRRRAQSLGTNKLPSQRPSTASPTIEMSRRVRDTISSVKALQQKIKLMSEQNISAGMITTQQETFGNHNLVHSGNSVAPNMVRSDISTTPFTISQLPSVSAHQDENTSGFQQHEPSPQPVEHPPVRAESRGVTPDGRLSSYKSRATSLLFNLKDNRKRVKSTYSPTKFKGLDKQEKNQQPSSLETVIDVPDFLDPDIPFMQQENSRSTTMAANQYQNPPLTLETQLERVNTEEQQRKLLQEEQQRKAAEEQQRRAVEEQQRKLLQEEQQRRAAEEQRRRHVQEEQQRKATEEQQRKLFQEEQQKKAADEQYRRHVQEEQQRKAAEEQQKRHVHEELQKRAKEEQQRKLFQEEQQRKAVEEQQQRHVQEEQQRRVAEEQQRRHVQEQRRRSAGEQQRKLFQEEQQRKAIEEQQMRHIQEEQQRRGAEEQQQRHIQEGQQKRAKEEQQRRLVPEEQRRRAENEQQKRLFQGKQYTKAAEEHQKTPTDRRQEKYVQEEQARRAAEQQETAIPPEEERQIIIEKQQRTAQEKQQKMSANGEQHRRVAEQIDERTLPEKVYRKEQRTDENAVNSFNMGIQQMPEQEKEEQQIEKLRRRRSLNHPLLKALQDEGVMVVDEKEITLKPEEKLATKDHSAKPLEEKRMAEELFGEKSKQKEENSIIHREKTGVTQAENQKQKMNDLQYYAFTSADTEGKSREKQFSSLLHSEQKSSPVRLNSPDDSVFQTKSPRPLAPASPASSLPRSNTSSPALGAKPSMFKVKDNTIRSSSFIKSVKPRFHKNFGEDFLVASPLDRLFEKGDDEREKIRSGAGTPVHAEIGMKRLTANTEFSTLLSSSSIQDYSVSHHRPYSRRSIVLDDDESRSVVSNLSEDVESYATSAADVGDVKGLFDFERPESACSFSSDVSRSLGKPPVVPPKTEKALRRAQRLTSRRMKKEHLPSRLAECYLYCFPSNRVSSRFRHCFPAYRSKYHVESCCFSQSYPMTQRKVLQDLGSGQYYVVDVPVQVQTKTFFDPETGKYVQLNVRESGQSVSRPHTQQTQPHQIKLQPQPLSQTPAAGKPFVLYQRYHSYPQNYQPTAVTPVRRSRSSAPGSLQPNNESLSENCSYGNIANEVEHNSVEPCYSPEKTPYMDTVIDTERTHNSVKNTQNPTESASESGTKSQTDGNSFHENHEMGRDIISMGELEDFMESSDW
uniref:DUF4585 domain-containing protein n=1 Tax=Oryzias melastigma TaxID=30732 RepID=A0A3B3B7F2_ORYME